MTRTTTRATGKLGGTPSRESERERVGRRRQGAGRVESRYSAAYLARGGPLICDSYWGAWRR
jgi:hypothetical protein